MNQPTDVEILKVVDCTSECIDDRIVFHFEQPLNCKSDEILTTVFDVLGKSHAVLWRLHKGRYEPR